MATLQDQREAHIAAHIYYLGESSNLSWKETNLAMRLALCKFNKGTSAATAYEAGANAIRVIARSHVLH